MNRNEKQEEAAVNRQNQDLIILPLLESITFRASMYACADQPVIRVCLQSVESVLAATTALQLLKFSSMNIQTPATFRRNDHQSYQPNVWVSPSWETKPEPPHSGKTLPLPEPQRPLDL